MGSLLAAQQEVQAKRKQLQGYVKANGRLAAELEQRDARIAALQEKLLPTSQPGTPARRPGESRANSAGGWHGSHPKSR